MSATAPKVAASATPHPDKGQTPACWFDPDQCQSRGEKMMRIAVVMLAYTLLSVPAVAQFKQEAKLVGTDAIGFSEQGYSAALSWDGNTALVGGPHDASGMRNERGAAWVFERSRGKWSQQTKLVGMGDIGNADQGFSVSLSSSANTAIVSGPFDNQNLAKNI